MTQFLTGIFVDQANAALKMLARLRGDGINPEIDKAFHARTIQLLEQLHQDITKLIQSGDLEIPALASSTIVKYNTFTERLQTIELFRYLVIINYGEPEKYFKKKP